MIRGYRLAFPALMAMLLTGCADFSRWLRQYTYPPEFRYTERDEVRATMHQLASQSQALNQLMQSSNGPGTQRNEIVRHLKSMEAAATKLDQGGRPSNHPIIDRNLPKLRRDLRSAPDAIEREAPSFSLAASVTGACVFCHGAR